MSLTRILVPTDFSPCADKALEFAIDLVEKAKGELILVHINPVSAGGDAMFFINPAVIDRVEQETTDAFTQLITRFPKLSDFKHRFLQETALSIDKIRHISEKEEADLIVMGTKNRDKSIEAYFGTNASHLMKRAKMPVLIIPENAEIEAITSLLLATDIEEADHLDSMVLLREITTILKAEIHIVHVVKDEAPVEVSLNPDKVMKWAKLMKGIEHHYHFVSHSDVESGIVHYAYDNEVQMLVIFARSHGLFKGLFHKSLAKKMAHHSKLPLLVLPE